MNVFFTLSLHCLYLGYGWLAFMQHLKHCLLGYFVVCVLCWLVGVLLGCLVSRFLGVLLGCLVSRFLGVILGALLGCCWGMKLQSC